MKREELENAIKHGESVWAYDDFMHRVIPYKANEIAITGINTNMPAYELKDLFATKQQAEHYLHHANITRTEILPFLTYEEFLEKQQIVFTGKENKEYCLFIELNQIKIFDKSHFKYIFIADLTEENFYKAYDECVRLFKNE